MNEVVEKESPVFDPEATKVVELVAKNPIIKAIMDYRTKNSKETETDLDVLEKYTKVGRHELLESVRALAKTGNCSFIVGRKGMKSRFVWTFVSKTATVTRKPRIRQRLFTENSGVTIKVRVGSQIVEIPIEVEVAAVAA